VSEQGIVRYTASDGTEVKLSPAIVAKYVLTGNGKASDKDVFSFLAKCRARGLNPLAGDAYMTSYRNRDGSTSTSVIVSKDYFVRTATQQVGFDGMRAGVVVANRKTGELTYREGSIVGKNSECLVGGWAEVYDKGRRFASRAEVSLDEYDQGRSLWKSKPATMIRKVALVQALREAYPGAFGGIYDRDEMPEPVIPIPDAPTVDEQPADAEAVEAETVAEPGSVDADEAEAPAEDGYYEQDVEF
jgi:phage recombination protein Bet